MFQCFTRKQKQSNQKKQNNNHNNNNSYSGPNCKVFFINISLPYILFVYIFFDLFKPPGSLIFFRSLDPLPSNHHPIRCYDSQAELRCAAWHVPSDLSILCLKGKPDPPMEFRGPQTGGNVEGKNKRISEEVGGGITLPETNSSPLKMDGWNTSFLLGWPIFRGYVSFRECNRNSGFVGFFHIFRKKKLWISRRHLLGKRVLFAGSNWNLNLRKKNMKHPAILIQCDSEKGQTPNLPSVLIKKWH